MRSSVNVNVVVAWSAHPFLPTRPYHHHRRQSPQHRRAAPFPHDPHLFSTSITTTTTRTTTTTIATVSELDPVIERHLRLLQDDTPNGNNDNPQNDSDIRLFLLQSNSGVQAWRTCLRQGRLPEVVTDDFGHDKSPWPSPPVLFDQICQALTTLELPRLVLRHPELLDTVLFTLIQLVTTFHQQQQHQQQIMEQDQSLNDDEVIDTENDQDEFYIHDDSLQQQLPNDTESPSSVLQALSEELVEDLLIAPFADFAQGVAALDQLLGVNHDLLLHLDNDNDAPSLSTSGFGLHDGLWQHSGWEPLAQIQQEQLASLPPLKQLLRELGRRPSAEDRQSLQRFPPRQLDPDGSLGAQIDPFQPESITGLTLSDSLAEMLPSEAVLLKGSPALRRLFLAKKAEAKLLSYQRSGWYDTPSRPLSFHRNLQRLPSAPGGPLVVCLDTSWSMSGRRETLSKAVVVACVTAAHQQGRDCLVVAFSSDRNVMETGVLTPQKNDPAAGLARLLDFLTGSFGGGTDVTGALQHVMTTLQGSDIATVERLTAADLLLVTDGEIPDPPVSDEIQQRLTRLQIQSGMQIHGLLIDKRESIPLSKLCTETHDFLCDYDVPSGAWVRSQTAHLACPTPAAASPRVEPPRFWPRSRNGALTQQCLSFPPSYSQSIHSEFQRMGQPRARYFSCRLQAMTSASSASWSSESLVSRRKRQGRKSRFDDDDDDLWDIAVSDVREDSYNGENTSGGSTRESVPSSSEVFHTRLQSLQEYLENKVKALLEQKRRRNDTKTEENDNSSKSSDAYRSELRLAVEKMSENLVEREEESRLVVLGLLSEEHVLLLGKPGTGKSQLGRRLSRICGGSFFQRLLTRFTTPEELFGPLSLKALENDEYKRRTEGFLPKASIAFLDEIFKANSAILNTLLTILNERQFDNGAGRREQCHIRCVVGASNEMPESEELNALYDRFLLRKEVLPVSDDGMMQMLKMPSPGVSPCDSTDEDASGDDNCDVVFIEGLDKVISQLSVSAANMEMSDDICVLIRNLRNFLTEDLGVDVSDRRLIKAARLLKISAASNGRNNVEALDCLLLQHIVWQVPEQRPAIRDWLWENLTPGQASVDQYRILLDSLRKQAMQIIRKTSGDVTGARGARSSDAAVVQSLAHEISAIVKLVEEKIRASERHFEVLHRATEHIWLSPEEAKAAQQFLLPRARSLLDRLNSTFLDAQSLELLLLEDPQIDDEFRLALIETSGKDRYADETQFSDAELALGMKEAKSKYDLDTFRKWKRARKRLDK